MAEMFHGRDNISGNHVMCSGASAVLMTNNVFTPIPEVEKRSG
jgi:hypothetical protein